LIAKDLVGGGPQTFGILVAAIGVGAVIGAIILPRLRTKLTKDVLIAGATLLYATAMLALAHLANLPALSAAMVISGMAWIAVLSSLQVAAQMALPNWVRSRGLAVFMAAFMGSMALGSLLWGNVAQRTSIATALITAAAGAVLAVGLTWRWKIGRIEEIDLTPSMHWPSPVVHEGVTPDRGPVMVTISYEVDEVQKNDFLAVVRELGKSRKRDGAFAWGIMEDTELPNRFVEYFMVESWLEHLRQHERVTNADRVLQENLRGLLVADSQPEITHYVAPDGKEGLL
jgi:MFS family permease